MDLLLGNGPKTNETIANAMQQLRKYTIELELFQGSGLCATMEVEFSMWSALRLTKFN
jgi:hypothetical protein